MMAKLNLQHSLLQLSITFELVPQDSTTTVNEQTFFSPNALKPLILCLCHYKYGI